MGRKSASWSSSHTRASESSALWRGGAVLSEPGNENHEGGGTEGEAGAINKRAHKHSAGGHLSNPLDNSCPPASEAPPRLGGSAAPHKVVRALHASVQQFCFVGARAWVASSARGRRLA